jgi:3D (Asp-Asp-Asp) domain-containing protein
VLTSWGPEKTLFDKEDSFSNLELPKRYYLLQPSERENKNQVETKKDLNDTVSVSIREVTAYNVGDPKQNYGNPCISANGENICAALKLGFKRCAANFVPFGTQLYIAHYGVCTVTDRMNRKYRNRVDIAMKVTEKDKALQFGFKKLKVTILRSSDQRWILKSRQRRVIDTKLELN